jgi:hypothetical protein
MSKFERLLEAGSTELPDCRCTAEMNLMAVVSVPGGDHYTAQTTNRCCVFRSLSYRRRNRRNRYSTPHFFTPPREAQPRAGSRRHHDPRPGSYRRSQCARIGLFICAAPFVLLFSGVVGSSHRNGLPQCICDLLWGARSEFFARAIYEA